MALTVLRGYPFFTIITRHELNSKCSRLDIIIPVRPTPLVNFCSDHRFTYVREYLALQERFIELMFFNELKFSPVCHICCCFCHAIPSPRCRKRSTKKIGTIAIWNGNNEPLSPHSVSGLDAMQKESISCTTVPTTSHVSDVTPRSKGYRARDLPACSARRSHVQSIVSVAPPHVRSILLLSVILSHGRLEVNLEA